MTAPRRRVRATAAFFHDLDRQLGSERGPNGEPSTNDFQVMELLRIVDRFATGWDDLPEFINGRSDYRIFIGSGVLVAGLSVLAQLSPDGTIELIQLDIDNDLDW